MGGASLGTTDLRVGTRRLKQPEVGRVAVGQDGSVQRPEPEGPAAEPRICAKREQHLEEGEGRPVAIARLIPNAPRDG